MIRNIMGIPREHGGAALSTIDGDREIRDIYVADGNLGKGLFAGSLIKQGSRIYRFNGPIIDFQQAVAKGEKQCYPLQISAKKYIDIESPGCFANHSCEPNAGIRDDMELIAITDINAGQEIRYDYSTTMDEDYFTMKCHCGTHSCRGEVTDFKLLPLSLQKKYLALKIVMRFISLQYSKR